MHPINRPSFLAAALLAQMATLCPLSAQTSWDAGGGLDTNTSNVLNWNNDTFPAYGPGARVTMTTGGTATVDSNMIFGPAVGTPALQFGGDFNLLTPEVGAGDLTLYGTNTGGNIVLRTNGAATAVQIDAPIRVFAVTAAAPLGNLLTIHVNNQTATNTALNITGGISRHASSTAATYDIRYGGSSITTTQATARIAGPISGLGTLANLQSGNASHGWAGDLIIAGNQSLSTANINIASTGPNPTSSARIVLGEAATDVQTWNAITLNNVMNVAIGGDIMISNLTGSSASARVTGAGVEGANLTINAANAVTIGSNFTLGGAAAGANSFALTKTGASTLTINTANSTYAGGTTLVEGGGSGSFGLALGANNALGTGPLVIGTGATGNARLRMASFSQSVSALSSGSTGARVIENFGAANSTLSVNGATSTTYTGFLRDRSTSSATATGNLGLIKDGVGTLTLANTSNQYTGATVLNDGVLEVASLSNGGIVKTVTSTAGSGTVTMTDTVGINPGMTFVAANLPTGFAVSTVDSATSLTINTTSGILTGSSIAHFGVASSLGLSTSAAANLVFGGGSLRYTGANTSTDRNFTINSGQTAKWDVANGATTLTLAGGASASSGGLEKLGAGTLRFSGAQAYTGTTVVSGGTLSLGAADRIDDASVLILAGGTFQVNGFSETLGGLGLSANGFINLDNDASVSGSVSFGNSASIDWGVNSLSFTGTSIGATSIRFGTDASGLTSGQLGAISVNGLGGWALDDSGYLTAIPEPSAFAALAGLAGLGLAGLRRRRRS